MHIDLSMCTSGMSLQPSSGVPLFHCPLSINVHFWNVSPTQFWCSSLSLSTIYQCALLECLSNPVLVFLSFIVHYLSMCTSGMSLQPSSGVPLFHCPLSINVHFWNVSPTQFWCSSLSLSTIYQCALLECLSNPVLVFLSFIVHYLSMCTSGMSLQPSSGVPLFHCPLSINVHFWNVSPTQFWCSSLSLSTIYQCALLECLSNPVLVFLSFIVHYLSMCTSGMSLQPSSGVPLVFLSFIVHSLPSLTFLLLHPFLEVHVVAGNVVHRFPPFRRRRTF